MDILNLYATPLNISLTGFLFNDMENYKCEARDVYESSGNEDYDITFIDGTKDQCVFAKLYPPFNNCEISRWFKDLEIWENLTFDQRAKIVYRVYSGVDHWETSLLKDIEYFEIKYKQETE